MLHCLWEDFERQDQDKKTVIIPLWTYDIEIVKAIVCSLVPEWKDVKVSLDAKYLGMCLGPRSRDSLWSSAIEKYIERVSCARSSGAGFVSSILECNVMCVSTLSYVWQFCQAGCEVLSAESKMMQRMTASPRYTLRKISSST